MCTKWLKDGKEIELIARIRVQSRTIEGHTTNELVIDDVVPEDAGKYTAIIESIAGSDRCEATLTVVGKQRSSTHRLDASSIILEALEKPAPPPQPEFTVKLTDTSVNLKQRATLSCKASGEPTYKWLKESEVIDTLNTRYQISSSADGTQTLVIESTELIDTSSYTCVASTDGGTAQTSAKLTVNSKQPCRPHSSSAQQASYGTHSSLRLQTARARSQSFAPTPPPAYAQKTIAHFSPHFSAQPPQFTRPLADQQCKLGEQIILECSVTGLPQPTVEFFSVHDEFRLTTGSRLSIQHDASNSHWRLVINNANSADFREYRAEARSSSGVVTSSANVREKAPDAVKPTFSEGLKTSRVKEGETVEMKVVVDGVPPPEVKFEKDGAQLRPDGDHVKLVRNEGEYTLRIVETTVNDAGAYAVSADNVAGKNESHATLTVEPRQRPPEFVRRLNDASIKERDSAQFSVIVESAPQPARVEWLLDGRPLDVDGSRIVRHDNDASGEHTLTINDARREDAGKLTVRRKSAAII